jgi:hypothetical protein
MSLDDETKWSRLSASLKQDMERLDEEAELDEAELLFARELLCITTLLEEILKRLGTHDHGE